MHCQLWGESNQKVVAGDFFFYTISDVTYSVKELSLGAMRQNKILNSMTVAQLLSKQSSFT